MVLSLQFLKEEIPGEKWQLIFHKTWPFYRKWFLSEGVMSRKGYLTSLSMLEHYMPELVPIYQQLNTLAGGGDLEARFLSMYCPPPYMSGCSQMAWNHHEKFLIRNYDYSPSLFEGAIWNTNWLKPIIGVSDCNWGLLDGVNGDGLTASLTFGGRNIVGEGFGIPIIIRYVLETCTTAAEAVHKLKSIPVHMAYNVTVMDASGDYATVYLSPDKVPVILHEPIATNQQEFIDWHYYAAITGTEKRKEVLEKLHQRKDVKTEAIVMKFLKSPLYNYNYEKNFGTLYTAKYNVTRKHVDLHWPDARIITQSFEDFNEHHAFIHLALGQIKKNIFK